MTDIKQNRIPVSLSGWERERLKRLADGWGVSLAGAVRRLIREAEISDDDSNVLPNENYFDD